MQKNWYIVYTRQKCETKVANSFTKNKIENFYPVNCSEVRHFRRMRSVYEPLFPGYVFVRVEERQLPSLSKFPNVNGLIYWKCKPAVVKHEEIEAVKEFIESYKNIRIENTQVDLNDVVRSIDSSFYSFDANFLSSKNNSVKVRLPSLGVLMVAEMKTEEVFKKGLTILQNPSYTN